MMTMEDDIAAIRRSLERIERRVNGFRELFYVTGIAGATVLAIHLVRDEWDGGTLAALVAGFVVMATGAAAYYWYSD